MKIGLIVPGFSADESDWCIPALLNLARSLAESNEVHVLALRYPHRRDVYAVGGATVHSLDGRSRRGPASLALWGTALAVLAREHRRAPFNILHAIWGGEAGLVAVLASRLLRVPAIVSLVGGELVGLEDIGYGSDLQPRQRLMNRVVLRGADFILCGSEQMTELARRRVPAARRGRVETCTLGVDTQMFSPDPRPLASRTGQAQDAEVRVLNVGSLIPVKGQGDLLHAFAQFAHTLPGARLTLVGTGALEGQLRKLAASLQIAERVEFAGAVRHEQLAQWYRRSDLFVQSSRHEVQAMATLEAAACGLAVAGTQVGVLRELADRGGAIACRAGDPAALCEAMLRACGQRAALGRCARQIVELEYNLEHVRDRLTRFYFRAQKTDGVIKAAEPFADT